MRISLKIGALLLAAALGWGRLAAAKTPNAEVFTMEDGPSTDWPFDQYTATLLEDGKSILFVGENTSAVWRYPGNWLTGGELRGVATMLEHGAVRLPDGRVLVAGGSGNECCGAAASRNAAVWDPKKRRWSKIAKMLEPRFHHTMELLPDGKVMVIGGTTTVGDGYRPSETVESWDPATNQWAYLEPMNVCRHQHSSVVLSDGSIMVMGGWNNSVESYDPRTGKWESQSPMKYPRSQFSAVALPDGRVLVAGGTREGYRCAGKACEREDAEIWDPMTKKWTLAGKMVKSRFRAAATLLKNGNVLVTGGWHNSAKSREYENDVELWDAQTMQWRIVGRLSYPRAGHTATLLPNGTVWLVGGSTNRLTEWVIPRGRPDTKPKE